MIGLTDHILKLFMPVIIMLMMATDSYAFTYDQWMRVPGDDKVQHSTVNSFAMTSDGLLWMCTETGLIVYDGVRSQFVDIIDKDKKKAAVNIKALTELPGGDVLVGSAEGLFLKNKDSAESKNIYSDEISEVRAIITLTNGDFCVASKDRLNILAPDGQQLWSLKTSPYEVRSLMNVNGTLIVGTNKGPFMLRDGKLAPTDITELVTTPIDCMVAVSGKIILYSRDAGNIYIYNVSGQDFTTIPVGSIIITGMAKTRDNDVLVSTNGDGVMQLDADTGQFTEVQGWLSDNEKVLSRQIYSLYISDDDQLFAGTYKLGAVYCTLNSEFFSYYKTDSYKSRGQSVRCVVEASFGLVVGTRDGAYVLDKTNGQSTHITKEQLGSNLVVSALYHRGKVYICTYGGGLSVYDPMSCTVTKAKFSSDTPTIVPSIKADKNGDLYICSIDGLYKLNGSIFDKIAKNEYKGKPISGNIYEIFFDSDGRFWVCTSKGMYLYDKDTQKLTREGLPAGFPFDKDVRQMCEAVTGDLLFVTDDGEIFAVNEKLEPYDHTNDLSIIRDARGVVQDPNRYLWITTTNGLYRYNPQAKVLTLYDTTEGVANLNFNPGSPLVTSCGDLMLCNTDGLLTANVKSPRETRMGHRKAYPSVIETMGGRQRLAGNIDKDGRFVITLPEHENHIKIYFSDFTFGHHHPGRYNYSTDGGKNWHSFDSDMSMLATNLQSGENEVLVMQPSNPATKTVVVINNKSDGKVPAWLLMLISVVFVVIIVLLVHRLAQKHRHSAHDTIATTPTSAASEEDTLEADLTKEMSGNAEQAAEILNTVDSSEAGSTLKKTPYRASDKEVAKDGAETKKKYTPNYMSEKECSHLAEEMNTLLCGTKMYVNPDLKIGDIARELGVSSHKISYVLSQYLKTTYYDYVYAFRVEEFKTLARNDKKRVYTLDALSEKAGFNSRATFFRAFKKSEGTTPGDFLKKLWEE